MIAGHYDPRGKVGDEPDAGGDRDCQPEYPDEGHVEVQIPGQSGANAGDLLVALIEHQRPCGRLAGAHGSPGAAPRAESIVPIQLRTALRAEHMPSARRYADGPHGVPSRNRPALM